MLRRSIPTLRMIILGIDPGIGRTGFGVIETGRSIRETRCVAVGCMTTPVGERSSQRLAQLSSDITHVIQTYNPDCMAIETLYFGTNVTTGIRVAQARGVLLCAAGQAGLSVRSFTPATVKSTIASSGQASKQQVERMVCRLLQLSSPPRPDDATDALAVALCAYMQSPVGQLRASHSFE